MVTEKTVDTVVQQLIECKGTIKVSCSSADVEKLIKKLRDERMILFHMGTVNYMYYPFEGTTVLYPQYFYTKNEYDRIVDSLSEKVRNIKAQILKTPYEAQREFMIHDILAKNVRYSDEGIESHSIVGPLLYGKGVCDGISKSAKVLFGECGIECYFVNGTARNTDNNKYEAHAWNIVRINGNCYHLDITYDNSFSERNIRYDYFNLSSSEIAKDHIIADPSWFYHINCSHENDYFSTKGLYFSEREQISNYCKNSLAAGKNLIYFRAASVLSQQEVNDIFVSCLKKLNRSMSYCSSHNSIRNIFRWEIEYK